jgi:hypothetical protein
MLDFSTGSVCAGHDGREGNRLPAKTAKDSAIPFLFLILNHCEPHLR